MPVRHARSEMRGRPPFGRRGVVGKNGSTRSHNGSGSSAAAITVHATSPARISFGGFVTCSKSVWRCSSTRRCAKSSCALKTRPTVASAIAAIRSASVGRRGCCSSAAARALTASRVARSASYSSRVTQAAAVALRPIRRRRALRPRPRPRRAFDRQALDTLASSPSAEQRLAGDADARATAARFLRSYNSIKPPLNPSWWLISGGSSADQPCSSTAIVRGAKSGVCVVRRTGITHPLEGSAPPTSTRRACAHVSARRPRSYRSWIRAPRRERAPATPPAAAGLRARRADTASTWRAATSAPGERVPVFRPRMAASRRPMLAPAS